MALVLWAKSYQQEGLAGVPEDAVQRLSALRDFVRRDLINLIDRVGTKAGIGYAPPTSAEIRVTKFSEDGVAMCQDLVRYLSRFLNPRTAEREDVERMFGLILKVKDLLSRMQAESPLKSIRMAEEEVGVSLISAIQILNLVYTEVSKSGAGDESRAGSTVKSHLRGLSEGLAFGLAGSVIPSVFIKMAHDALWKGGPGAPRTANNRRLDTLLSTGAEPRRSTGEVAWYNLSGERKFGRSGRTVSQGFATGATGGGSSYGGVSMPDLDEEQAQANAPAVSEPAPRPFEGAAPQSFHDFMKGITGTAPTESAQVRQTRSPVGLLADTYRPNVAAAGAANPLSREDIAEGVAQGQERFFSKRAYEIGWTRDVLSALRRGGRVGTGEPEGEAEGEKKSALGGGGLLKDLEQYAIGKTEFSIGKWALGKLIPSGVAGILPGFLKKAFGIGKKALPLEEEALAGGEAAVAGGEAVAATTAADVAAGIAPPVIAGGATAAGGAAAGMGAGATVAAIAIPLATTAVVLTDLYKGVQVLQAKKAAKEGAIAAGDMEQARVQQLQQKISDGTIKPGTSTAREAVRRGLLDPSWMNPAESSETVGSTSTVGPGKSVSVSDLSKSDSGVTRSSKGSVGGDTDVVAAFERGMNDLKQAYLDGKRGLGGETTATQAPHSNDYSVRDPLLDRMSMGALSGRD